MIESDNHNSEDLPVGSPDITSAANGQAYRAYLESALAVLAPLTAIAYYSTSIPSSDDEALFEIVSAFTGWTRPKRANFLEALPAAKRPLFGIFGHRAVTLAVRRGDPEWLRIGLVGNTIGNYKIPESRNVDAALAVFYHCARKLVVEPQALFDEAAEFATDEMAVCLRAFGRRADVTLKMFGWREIKTQDGVRYKFEW